MKLSTPLLFLTLLFAILLLAGPILVLADVYDDCLANCKNVTDKVNCRINCCINYKCAALELETDACDKYCECAHKFICIENPLKYKTIEQLIPAITNFLKNIALAIGGIMIIWSGIQIMTGMATGEKEAKVLKGKKTLMWTMLGIAIVISIDFIVGFIKELIGG